MTKYIYNIGNLETRDFPELSLTDVVVGFTYLLQCEHENVYRNLNLKCVLPAPSPDNFVSYADLTKEAVQAWAETYTTPAGALDAAKTELLEECVRIKNQEQDVTAPDKTQLPPWITPSGT